MENLWLVKCEKSTYNDRLFKVGNYYLAEVDDEVFSVYRIGTSGVTVTKYIKGVLQNQLYFYKTKAFMECLGYIWQIISSVSNSKECIDSKGAISFKEAEFYFLENNSL